MCVWGVRINGSRKCMWLGRVEIKELKGRRRMRVQRELRVRDFNGKFNRVCLIRPNRYRYYTVLLNSLIIVPLYI